MKINKNSWHYKLLRDIDGEVPRSLCPYFWKLVLSCLMLTIGVVAILFVAGIALAPLLKFLIDVPKDLIMVGGLSWCVAAVVGIFQLFKYLLQSGLKRAKKIKPPEDNLFVEWAKAKHRKVCPILEFTDD